MGNMEPRRLHERGEEMGKKRGGIQEVPSCLLLPRELPFTCMFCDLLKTILTRSSPSSPSDEGHYQGRDAVTKTPVHARTPQPTLVDTVSPDHFLQCNAKGFGCSP